MSHPTSKKESKELLKFFNSIDNRIDHEIEFTIGLVFIYVFSILYILKIITGV